MGISVNDKNDKMTLVLKAMQLIFHDHHYCVHNKKTNKLSNSQCALLIKASIGQLGARGSIPGWELFDPLFYFSFEC